MSQSTISCQDLETLSHQLQEAQSLADMRARQLVQAEKLASMGLLAAGIAHEIKNPVGYISNNLEILEEYVRAYQKIFFLLPKLLSTLKNVSQPAIKRQIDQLESIWLSEDIDQINTDINQLVEDSMTGANRIADMVKHLNGFIRVEEEKPKLCDMNEELNTILKLIQHEFKHQIKAHVTLNELPKIYIFPSEIHQAFLNLLMNAIHSISGSGDIWVTAEHHSDSISISIKDNGCGIQAPDIKKIFNPFFTTKSAKEGTGLGLSICVTIVKNHQGSLTVESTPTQGSEFVITLPAENQPQDIVSIIASFKDAPIH